jgi:hypothetical protein
MLLMPAMLKESSLPGLPLWLHSRLHPAYGEDVLPAVPGLLPHVVRICGKMLMLDQVRQQQSHPGP